MRNWKETLDWYKKNNTTREIGFNPDGMCLKVCRTARGIGSMFATAKQAQDATPERHRIYRVRDLRKGMKLYFDDPHDANTAGHIATMIGRVKDFDEDDLNDVLVETNSVVSGKLVVVRASYFTRYWGDAFQFGATWLNGLVLDVAGDNSRVHQFRRSGPSWNVRLLDDAIKHGRSDVRSVRDGLDKAVATLPDDDRDTRVRRVKDYYKKHRILKMGLLTAAINQGGRTGIVKDQRDKMRQLIKSLPPR